MAKQAWLVGAVACVAVAAWAVNALPGAPRAPAPVATTAPTRVSMLSLARASTPAPAAIAMRLDGGVYVVPVSVNGVLTLDCVVDSGASDVNIPAEMFRKLVRAGSVKPSDYAGMSDYTLADGSTEHGRTFRIHSLKVGNVVVPDVIASVGGNGSTALLGQSFLRRFRSWSQDNTHHTLALVGPVSPSPSAVAANHPLPRVTTPDPNSVAQVRPLPPRHAEPIAAATSSQQHMPAADADDSGLTAQHSRSR